MMRTRLYRVLVRSTISLQPNGTTWQKNVLYCGYDRLEALRVFFESQPRDVWSSFGGPARETLGQSKGV